MNSNPNMLTTKEISKGILLHKQQIYKQSEENTELIYIFKVRASVAMSAGGGKDLANSGLHSRLLRL